MTRKAIPLLVIILAAIGLWFIYQSHAHRLTVRTYFHNAQGLQRHAKVRANGLDVGVVEDVTLTPRLGEQPVEVLLSFEPRYTANIRSDATATIETEGLLGPPYIEIDLSSATGGPIGNTGVLKGLDKSVNTNGVAATALQNFLNVLSEKLKKQAEASQKSHQTSDSANSQTKK